MVSLSDILTSAGWTTTQVIWELRMEQLDGDGCRYTNTVTSRRPGIPEVHRRERPDLQRGSRCSAGSVRTALPGRDTAVRTEHRSLGGRTMSGAILFDHPGEPNVLRWQEVEALQPRPHEVVISVAAAGVNNADLLQRRGHYPVPSWAPRPLGLECSGTITAVGADVTAWSTGDEVCALLDGGGYAD